MPKPYKKQMSLPRTTAKPDVDFSLLMGASEQGKCQDALRYDLKHQRFAVADGVSTTFLPGLFANALVTEYCLLPDPVTIGAETERLADDVDAFLSRSRLTYQREAEQYVLNLLKDKSSHSAQKLGEAFYSKKLESVSASTFAGIHFSTVGATPGKLRWTALTIGDSCIFHFGKGGDLLDCFPYKKSVEFKPGTQGLTTFDVPGGHPSRLATHKGDAGVGDVFILGTDAISKWLLLHHENGGLPDLLSRLKLDDSSAQETNRSIIANARSTPPFNLDVDDVALLHVSVREPDLPSGTTGSPHSSDSAPPAMPDQRGSSIGESDVPSSSSGLPFPHTPAAPVVTTVSGSGKTKGRQSGRSLPENRRLIMALVLASFGTTFAVGVGYLLYVLLGQSTEQANKPLAREAANAINGDVIPQVTLSAINPSPTAAESGTMGPQPPRRVLYATVKVGEFVYADSELARPILKSLSANVFEVRSEDTSATGARVSKVVVKALVAIKARGGPDVGESSGISTIPSDRYLRSVSGTNEPFAIAQRQFQAFPTGPLLTLRVDGQSTQFRPITFEAYVSSSR